MKYRCFMQILKDLNLKRLLAMIKDSLRRIWHHATTACHVFLTTYNVRDESVGVAEWNRFLADTHHLPRLHHWSLRHAGLERVSRAQQLCSGGVVLLVGISYTVAAQNTDSRELAWM